MKAKLPSCFASFFCRMFENASDLLLDGCSVARTYGALSSVFMNYIEMATPSIRLLDQFFLNHNNQNSFVQINQ